MHEQHLRPFYKKSVLVSHYAPSLCGICAKQGFYHMSRPFVVSFLSTDLSCACRVGRKVHDKKGAMESLGIWAALSTT